MSKMWKPRSLPLGFKPFRRTRRHKTDENDRAFPMHKMFAQLGRSQLDYAAFWVFVVFLGDGH